MKTMILAAVLLVRPAAGAVLAEEYDARLSAPAGAVEVLAGGETDAWREAEDGMPLSSGDKVRTGADSSAEISLDDGGLIRLGPDSALDVSSLSAGSSSFFLRLGSIVAKIRAGFLKPGKRLQVRTPPAVCAIRGTEFGVEHDEVSGETTAGVFDEGSLSVASADKDGKTLAEETVGKGREVRLRAGARALRQGAMLKLLRHRKSLTAARGRLETLRKNWKRLDPEKRRELRKRFMVRKAVRNARDKKKGAAGPNQKGGGLKSGGEPGRPNLPDKLKNAIKRADDRTGNKQKRKMLGE
ncbi:MAG: hypothetical protein A3J79_02180 [Elusimicrobia bacterium RIFOXYB2_FULL_62_6]|nr:MAG: hypothetical protein A3J79_02180 [Elusimicrobia bacterium RIFOXYB2_FULL_62_6]